MVLSAIDDQYSAAGPVPSAPGLAFCPALGVTLDGVRVTEADIARIPVGNVRVTRAEFGAVWAAAEDRTRPRDEGMSGWFTAGVAVSCRWLASAVVESVPVAGALAMSPVGKREVRAYEGLIEAEFLAAERLTTGART